MKISLCKQSPVTLRLLEQINYCHSAYIHTAHPSVTLLPRQNQTVCLGESISFNCNGEGLSLELYSPHFLNENSALALFPNDNVMTCNLRPTSAAAIVFVDPPGNSSISGTLVLQIPLEQSLGTFNVFCRVSTINSVNETNSTFSVIGRKNLLTYCRPY